MERDRVSDGPPTGSGTSVSKRLVDGITSHALFMLDADGAITTWPPPATGLYGYDATEAVGRAVHTLFADEAGEGMRASVDDLLDEAGDAPVEVEGWHERADGSVFWGTLTLSPLVGDDVRGYAAVCQDTTDRKEYERMLERQNDRLKEFTDILAHDLRNPLNVVDQRVSLYRESGDEAYLRAIEETTDRMLRLVDDLLRVARQGGVVEDPEPTDIGQVVETAWEGIGRESGAVLRYDLVRTVSADPDRLCELFENLFRNAVEHGSTGSQNAARSGDAVEHGSTSPQQAGDAVEHGSTGNQNAGRSGDAVEHGGGDVTVRVGPLDDGFYVEDDGPGIPEPLRAEVFDHGVTTTENGTGYGLSVVRTIVNAHGWDVAVTESASGGARFEVTGIEFLD